MGAEPLLAIVVKGFPRLSETFIAREFEALERRGLSFALFALRHPGGDAALVDNSVKAAPRYLPEYLHEAPLRVAQALVMARRLPGFASAWRAFRHDLSSEFARARVRRFGQACVLATSMPASVRHVHAHFAHSPTSVVRYAALMRGIGFSISAHAKDIWTAPDWDLQRKLKDAAFVTVCNRAGFERLAAQGGGDGLHLIRHGLSPELLAQAVRAQSRDGSAEGDPVRIVCVARAVEKKGLRTLIDALAQLPRTLSFRLDHYGGGEMLSALKEAATALELGDRVTWHGATPHAAIVAALDRSDLFVLPAVVGPDGDRDGIPNALIEAQARGVAVLSTRAGGIEEVVSDGATGRLVAAGDAVALARALSALIGDPALRTRLGSDALMQARRDYDAEAGYDEIARLLNERTGS
ncbi:MAG: glycosyltransferase [Alphaproteobacteria bacterium]|nr:glycosyltransferase [Alphaproteobacteria bacterium]